MEKRINRAKVTVADLLKATSEVHKLPPEDRDWEGRLIAMARLFKGQPDKAQAIEYRLAAMTRILQSGSLPGWATPEAPDGATSIAEPVWEATATEPLVFGGKEDEPYFETASFLNRVLALAQPEGNA